MLRTTPFVNNICGQLFKCFCFFIFLQESLCAYSAEAISLFKRAIMLSKVASLILPNLFTTINWLKE